jgi:transcription antitermination factor NusG
MMIENMPASNSANLGRRLDCAEPRWYSVYTCAQHEKRVAQQLDARGVAHYLPLFETTRRWKDRRKLVQLPLFAGYVFVQIALENRLEVLRLPGVVRLVGFNGSPAPLADEEVEGLRRALASGTRAEPHRYLTVGRRVRITSGPLAGREGILKRWKGVVQVVLSVELLKRSIIVHTDALDVEPIDRPSSSLVGATLGCPPAEPRQRAVSTVQSRRS